MIVEFNPFPILTTGRLILRKFRAEDQNEIFFLRSDSRILEFIDTPKANNLDDAKKYIKNMNDGIANNKWIIWGIALKANTEKIIGSICLWNFDMEKELAGIGYVLHPDFQGKGIMHETMQGVLDYGFNKIKLDCIEAELDADNLKSIRLLERNNFLFERKVKNLVVYALKNRTNTSVHKNI